MSVYDFEDYLEIRGSCFIRIVKKILDFKDRRENRDLSVEEIVRYWRELLVLRDRNCFFSVSSFSFVNDMIDFSFSDVAYVVNIIRRMLNGKVVGSDRMLVELFKVCSDVNVIWVRFLWNLCW